MAANLSAFIKYLGHSQIAIKSIVTGKPGAQERHFQAITINKAEEFITLRNGKRQLWINLQKLKPEIGKYITFSDIESYKNVYIDLDCEKPDGMKDYAATEAERVKALSQLPILRTWLESHSLKCGLELHTGNGAGMVLPIPETKAEPVFIAKLSTFLKKVQADIPCTDPAMFDPPRVIGIPSTINAKLETEDRKNQVREIVGDIPARVEDQALLDFINAQVPDQAILKEWTKKYNEPQAPPESDKDTIDAEDILDRLTGFFEYEPELKALLDGNIERFKGDRSAAEYGVCGRLVKFGFTDTEIDFIMCKVSKIGKWAEEGPHYRFEQTLRKLREAEAGKEEPKGPTVIDAISALKGVCDGAKTKDGAGFNGFHIKTFKNIIDKAVSEGTLSPREEKTAYKFLGTYKKQLKGLGIEYSAIVPIYRVLDQRSEEEIGIQVNNRRLNEVSADALKALIEHNTPPRIFSRAGSLARLHENESLVIEPLYKEALGLELADATSFHRAKDESVTIVSPPMGVISYILAAHDWPELPEIKTIIETPVIRPDGSILLTPGYDEATKLYLSPIVDLSSLVIPEVLTQKHAEEAARYILDEIFADFPFENNASRTNTLAALLSVIVRPVIKGNIPLFILDKPQAGTGASLIADIIATITTGKPACMWGMPETEDEWRKAITSALIDGSPIIVIDNVVGMLRSAALSRALTSKIWRDRLLGKSQMLDLPQEAVWIATGNNIQIGGDTARRSVWIRLDATCARPWTRTEFKHPDILGWIGENHDSIIAYLLIMARAWVQAGKPLGSIKLGGFNEWARVISGILEFAGVEDFMGNATQLYDEMDQDVQQWDAFLAEWMTFHGENPIKAAVLRDELTSGDSIYRTFRDAMPDDVASALSRTNVGSLKLSHVLRKHLNQVYPSGKKLTQEQDKHSKMVLWKVAGVCGCSEKSHSTPSGHFAGVAGVKSTTGKLFSEKCLPVNEILNDNKMSGGQTPATPANQPKDSDCGKTQTPANHVKVTDPVKVRFFKDYRTQIAKLGEPNSFVDKLFLAGEIAELQRWKAEDLVKRDIVEQVA